MIGFAAISMTAFGACSHTAEQAVSSGAAPSAPKLYPKLCETVQAMREMPQEALAHTLADEQPPALENVSDDARAKGLEVLRADPALQKVMSDDSIDIMYAIKATAGSATDVEFNINFQTPVELPSRLGLPVSTGEGGGPPPLDKDGWVKRVATEGNAFKDVLSASFFVVDGKLKLIIPSQSRTYCWVEYLDGGGWREAK